MLYCCLEMLKELEDQRRKSIDELLKIANTIKAHQVT